MSAPYLEQLSEKIKKLGLGFPDDIELECKQFLSGAALYANGQICAALSPAGFVVKLPEPVRRQVHSLDQWEDLPKNRLMLGMEDYVTLPLAVIKDNQLLKSLLELSIDSVIMKDRLLS